ncbi:hypothetical protein MLD38_015499 [Melastoma candidum]|uniref:Uncharacterized protein n=1 Tax=Melastoma candidum TaxID=119954 RepID=A0ACB9RGG4_9MYRT|nr:hypothetical protein MLD38_015499 [Melastoma candidum]
MPSSISSTLTRLKISSRSLDKFIKSQKNLSRRPPRLFPPEPLPSGTPSQELSPPELSLDHPLLRKLCGCGSIREFGQVHARLVTAGLSQDSLVTSQVVKRLCSIGEVEHAVVFYKGVVEKDAFLGNSIVRCLVNMGDGAGALEFYGEEMVGRDVAPNHYTFPIVLKACVGAGSVRKAEKAHGRAVRFGFEADLFVRNALIHMYAFFGMIGSARTVFDVGPVLDLVSWNAMVDGYVKNGDISAARELFDEMPDRDVFGWNSMIYGYVANGDMEEARYLFDSMPVRDVVSGNCMIEGYARIGNISLALEIFDHMPLRNVVSWNSMLALCVRCKDHDGCFKLFDRMMKEKEIVPDCATLMSVLTATAHAGDLERGKYVHSYIKGNGIEPDVLLYTALLNMYAKCGAMDLACEVFDQMPDKSVVSWNSMIMAYGLHGHGEKALEVFLEMVKRGPLPNHATFVCILSACAHAGLVLEGWWCFDVMCRVYRLEPKIEHYGCMVDLLSRSGLLEDSKDLLSKIPTKSGSPIYSALLSACQTRSSTELGKLVATRLMEMNPGDIGPYVLLSNMYAAEGNWDAVENVRITMREKGLQKPSGCSVVSEGCIDFESPSKSLAYRRSIVCSLLSDIGSQIKSTSKNVMVVEQ